MATNNVARECRTSVRSKEHAEYPEVFQHLTIIATHPQHGQLATVKALVIDRDECQNRFLMIMDSASDDLMHLSTEVFDSKGKFLPHLVHNNFLKGTGSWGEELNEGKIIHIDTIDVVEDVRMLYLF